MPQVLWILLIVLLIFTILASPGMVAHSWGYYPSGVGLVLIVLVIVLLFR